MRNENMNNTDRNDRDRGLNRTISGGPRNSDRDRNIGLNRNPNTRPGGGRPFNRNDRQQGGGPRGNNNSNASTGNGGGAYGRR